MVPQRLVKCFFVLFSIQSLALFFNHDDSSNHVLDFKSFTYDIGSWLGRQTIDPAHEEGAAHGKVNVPDGAEFVTLPVGGVGPETIPVFRTANGDEKKLKLEHAFIVIHGKRRDGGYYWKIMSDAVKPAEDAKLVGESLVAAPQFFSAVYNKGQYGDNDVAWGDLNAWQSGSVATSPTNTNVSSIDALDTVIDHYSDLDIYPSMKNITVIGHGGGGQLVQRYAVVAKDAPDHIHVRFIHGDPSSCVYFTKDRPSSGYGNKKKCKYYNTWRYGFDHFPGTLNDLKSPKEYFQQYIKRDVISLVGYQDVSSNGDESCMAKLQGGEKRRDRNLIWYRYINSLARTNVPLSGFPGEFKSLPDWSGNQNDTFGLRLIIVEDAAHNMEQVLASGSGKSALFSNGDVDMGWRPADAS